jgi:hypothetical protein
VLSHPIQNQVDVDLAWQHPVEIDPRHTGHPPNPVENSRLDQIVALGQIDTLGRDPGLYHRNVVGVEREDENLTDVGRQLRFDLVHLLADLHADDVQIEAPVELQKDLGLVGVGLAVERLDRRQGRQNLLHRFDDLLFHLPGIGVRIGDDDADKGGVDLGQKGQWDPYDGDTTQDQNTDQDHGGGDGPGYRQPRELHQLTSRRGSWIRVSASGTSSSSCSSTRSTSLRSTSE